MFRTSCIFISRTSVIFCSGNPIFFVPNFRFFNYGHPDLIRITGWRNGHLQLMSVKKERDEKGLPQTIIFTIMTKATSTVIPRSTVKTENLSFSTTTSTKPLHKSHHTLLYILFSLLFVIICVTITALIACFLYYCIVNDDILLMKIQVLY
jgi:hypothetical protein